MIAEDRRAPFRGRVVAALLVAAGMAGGGCDRGAPLAPPAKCPARFTADGGRQGRILERLRATGEGAQLRLAGLTAYHVMVPRVVRARLRSPPAPTAEGEVDPAPRG